MQPFDCSGESFDLIPCEFHCGSQRDSTSGLQLDVFTYGGVAPRPGVMDRARGRLRNPGMVRLRHHLHMHGSAQLIGDSWVSGPVADTGLTVAP